MKKMKVINFGFAVLFLGGFAACNDTADSVDENRDSLQRDSIERADNARLNDSAAMGNKDAQWVSEVLESNFAEIELAKQAQQKATNKEVKDLAVMLEKDHMALVNEAKDLANKKNWTVATGETSDATRKREDMMDDEVKAYQKDWLEMMEDKHENSIKKFDDYADDAADTDLKSWITSTLPKLRAHHDRIMQVQKAVK
jgi:putative membrane protein